MKADFWKKLSMDALAESYREASAKHGRLLDGLKTRAANKEYDRVTAIEAELQRRGEEAQGFILKLLDDPEPGTRFWAASAALGFASAEGARVLGELARPPPSQIGVSAAMLLRAWKDGSYTPKWAQPVSPGSLDPE
ncbi:DUF2019 domain-containing protein [Corallococcus exiguus]|uniref:DUF2019 domain-containing protein n=1 Tax=Corallococcus TaxID=83461 RepID=UPI0013157BA3|nr:MULTISPECIES: DUF2019 domain-containing protein [Corallococcus]NNB86932.1 DUF2019 domain-containing protein [Corallococcus exiguus]NNB97788.1 DUF2019 domain-containing protein [Corallococcus exiguus]NNC01642.1 DUF2019 domain-containing protein [Corallococcus exiguus]NPC46627.1 DUF2019 domain-containing protein [Corallococcus exiguus]